MAISPVKRSMRTLLWVEVLTASLIVLIGIVVFVRVASGHAPHHQPFTLNMFTVPPGVGTSTLFLGIVFGFLSFAGFEAAATLGEEAPIRGAPSRARSSAWPCSAAIFYTIGTAIEMLGFGTTTKGVAAFASSSSLFGTLGAEYVTPAVGDIVTLGTTIAAIGCCLATLVAAARLLFAMSRGGVGDRRLSRVSEKSGVPAVAAAAISVAAVRRDPAHPGGGHLGGVQPIRLVRHGGHPGPACRLRDLHRRCVVLPVRPWSPPRPARQPARFHHPGSRADRARLHALPQRAALAQHDSGPGDR